MKKAMIKALVRLKVRANMLVAIGLNSLQRYGIKKELEMEKQVRTVMLTVVTIVFLASSSLVMAIERQSTMTGKTKKISIIPRPMEMRLTDGYFSLKYTTAIYAESGSEQVRQIAIYLAEHLRPATGFSLVVLDETRVKSSADSFLLTTTNADDSLGEEGYELVVTKSNVVVRAPKPAGLFYAVQTIRQLLPAKIERNKIIKDVRWRIPCVQIKEQAEVSVAGVAVRLLPALYDQRFR